MANLYDLMVSITADSSGLTRGLNSATTQAQSAAGKMTTTFGKLGTAITAAFSVAAIIKFASAIGKTVSEVVALGDNIDKQSQRLGVSKSAFQEWDYVLNLAGTSMDNMSIGMKTLTNQLDEAKNGSDTAQTAFSKLGMSMDDINSMSREEAFEAAIYGMQSLADSTERAALANDLFGRSGQELTPLFNMSATETQRLIEQYRALGNVMTDQEVAACATFNDSLTTLKSTFGAIRNSVIVAVLPAFNTFVNFLTNSVAPVVRTVASTISNVLSALFGTAATSASTALSSAASSADALTSSATTAAGATSALQRELMGFDKMSKLQDNSAGGGGGASSASSAAAAATTASAASVIEGSVGKIGEAIGKIKAWLGGLDISGLKTAFDNLVSSVSEFCGIVFGNLKTAYEEYLLPLAEWTINEAAPSVVNALSSAFRILTSVMTILEPVSYALEKYLFKPLRETILSGADTFLQMMASYLNDVADVLDRIKNGDYSSVFDIFGFKYGILGSESIFRGTPLEGVGNVVDHIASDFKNSFSSIPNTIGNIMNGLTGAFESNRITGGIHSGIQGMIEGIAGFFGIGTSGGTNGGAVSSTKLYRQAANSIKGVNSRLNRSSGTSINVPVAFTTDGTRQSGTTFARKFLESTQANVDAVSKKSTGNIRFGMTGANAKGESWSDTIKSFVANRSGSKSAGSIRLGSKLENSTGVSWGKKIADFVAERSGSKSAGSVNIWANDIAYDENGNVVSWTKAADSKAKSLANKYYGVNVLISSNEAKMQYVRGETASGLLGRLLQTLFGSAYTGTNPVFKFAARGGIVNSATLFGNTVVGEAGKEAILPLENNTEWMSTWAEKAADAIVGKLKSATAGSGNGQPIYVNLTLDGKTISQTVVDTINRTARTTGINPLSAFL